MSTLYQKIRLIVLGVFLIVCYYFLENSQGLKTFLDGAFEYRVSTGFGFYFIVGLIKYLSLGSGIVILASILYYQIKKK